MEVAAMQGADQPIRSSLGVHYLAHGHFDIRELDQRPSGYKTLALPLSNSRPFNWDSLKLYTKINKKRQVMWAVTKENGDVETTELSK